MSDEALSALARCAGIAVEWTDAADHHRRVTADVLRAILEALGLPCDTPAHIRESKYRLRAETASHLPPLITADAGEPIVLAPQGGRQAELILEDGTQQSVALEERKTGSWVLPAVASPGYHTLHIGDDAIGIANAPRRCYTIGQIAPDARLWGLAVQLYGLRRTGDGGIGDAGALRTMARKAAQHGADAIAISPTHALFSAEPAKYSPYSPSSRLFLNPLYADPAL